MKNMQKKITIALMVTGLVFGALLIVPPCINIKHYKPLLISKASQQLGKEFTFDDLSFRLLPYPTISLTNIAVLDRPDAKFPAIATVKKASASLSWLPLLRKKVRINDLSLQDLEMHLHTVGEKNNWDLPAKANEAHNVDVTSPEVAEVGDVIDPKAAQAKNSEPMNWDVTIEQASIVNGYIAHHKDSTLVAKNINLSFKMSSLKGPYDIKGNMVVQDVPVVIDTYVEQLELDGATKMRVSLKSDKHSVLAVGETYLADKRFVGEFSADVNLASFSDAPFAKHVLTIQSPLIVDEDHIICQSLQAQMNGANLKGSADVNIKSQSVNMDLVGLPGEIAIKGQGLAPHSGNISLQMVDLQALLKWLSIDMSSLPAHASLVKKVKFSTQYDQNAKGILCKDLVVRLDDKEARGSVQVNQPEIQFDIISQDGDGWLKLLGQPLTGSGGKLHLKGTVNTETLEGVVSGKALNADFNARVAVQGAKINANLTMQHPNANQLLSLVNMPMQDLTLGALKLSTHITSSVDEIKIHDLNLQLHPKDALSVQVQGSIKPLLSKMDLSVNVRDLNLGHLQGSNAAASKSSPVGTGPTPARPSLQSGGVGAADKWSKDPINLSILQQWSGKVKLYISRLTHDKMVLREVNLPVVIESSAMHADLSALCFKGRINSSIVVSAKQGNSMSLSGTLHDLSIEDALRAYNMSHTSGGVVNASLNVKAQMISMYSLMNTLNGELKFSATGAKVKGNFMNLFKGLDLTRMLSGQQNKSDVLNIRAHMPINNGVIELQDVVIDSPVGKGAATGNVSLAQWNINTQINIDTTEVGFKSPLKIHTEGSLDNPKNNFSVPLPSKELLDKAGFGKVTQQVDKIIPGAGALLDGILGGSTDAKAKKSKQSSKNGLNIKDLLKGF